MVGAGGWMGLGLGAEERMNRVELDWGADLGIGIGVWVGA